MKNKFLFTLVLVTFMQLGYSQTLADSAWYLGRPHPGNTQTLFPLDVPVGFSAVEKMAFTADGREIYYSELNINPSYSSFSESKIKYYRYSEDQWNGPFILFENYHSPSFSVLGDTMFVQKGIPSEIWYSAKTDTGWSTPSKFMENYALQGNGLFEGKLHQTNNGTYYCVSSIASGGLGGTDVAKVVITDTDTIVQSLGYPLNNSGNNNYLYMAKDESYAITYTLQGGDHLEGRALVSYPKEDGSWTNPKQMGFGGWAVTLSPDEKFLFYSSYDGSRFDTYWIQIDELLDSLKHTNFAPYVINSLPDQNYTLGKEYTFTISDNIFFDDDGNNTLTYTASYGNNKPLPSWLAFNPETKTLSGILTEEGSFNIKVTATDTEGMSASSVFRLKVEADKTAFDDINNNSYLSVFPNPANTLMHVRIYHLHLQPVHYQLIDLGGKVIIQGMLHSEIIDISKLTKGVYILNLSIEKEIICRKIIVE